MIQDARHPLLLVGAGANRKMTSNMLRSFIDKTGIHFFTTQMGKGVVDERHGKFIGNAALSANDYLHCAIDRSDLIRAHSGRAFEYKISIFFMELDLNKLRNVLSCNNLKSNLICHGGNNDQANSK